MFSDSVQDVDRVYGCKRQALSLSFFGKAHHSTKTPFFKVFKLERGGLQGLEGLQKLKG